MLSSCLFSNAFKLLVNDDIQRHMESGESIKKTFSCVPDAVLPHKFQICVRFRDIINGKERIA
ncbi:CLUMA_CG019767, isoform A [Clunio marinus]|uniref:CLUMA_CG019767, isoform A n=1 Tax=Clunio marinus TaxID=568069 RepID=A0A1J1J1N5_9DIPT|nr:CLUMA_CG019767, isoform A [Clunio marinus]